MKIIPHYPWVHILGRWLILLGVVIVCFWAWKAVHTQKIAMFQVQKALNELPERITGQAALKSELDRHKHDIERLYKYTPTRDEVNEFVNELENEAKKRKVKISIQDFIEDKKLDENGNPIEDAGPLRDVYVKGMATGSPEQLVALIHALEHMPYLVRLSEWDLKALAQGNSGVTVANIPADDTTVQPQEVPGQLFFTLILALRYE